MDKRNVSELLIKAVESSFISVQDYEYIVYEICDYIPDNYAKGDEVTVPSNACPDEYAYDNSYSLDVDGQAHWKGDTEKNMVVLEIDSPKFKVLLELPPDELLQIWQGYDLGALGKKLAIGYIESYISGNTDLSVEGLNAVISGYGGLCYAEVTLNDELLVVFVHEDFYIEHFFPNILTPVTAFLPNIMPAGFESDLHLNYRCNCESRGDDS